MTTRKLIALGIAIAALVVGCGGVDEFDNLELLYYEADNGVVYPVAIPTELGVDASRSGVIDFDDPDDVEQRFEPEDGYGALFVANIDDDARRCGDIGDDEALETCSDAELAEVVNDLDLSDMARIKTRPTGVVGPGTYGVLDVDEASRDRVRIYKNVGDGEEPEDFKRYVPGEDRIDDDPLEEGVEFAIEGITLVEDDEPWDGVVELSWEIEIPEAQWTHTDRAHMELAPVLLRHHLHEARRVFASDLGARNAEFVADLQGAVEAAEVEDGLELLDVDDPWVQDFVLNGYMAIPGPDGPQSIQLFFRSANLNYPGSLTPVFEAYHQMQDEPLPPLLREAGRIVYDNFHGAGAAGHAIYDEDRGFESPQLEDDLDYADVVAYLFGAPSDAEYPEIAAHYDRVMDADTLDSFGNTEVIPPHVGADGSVHRQGRILRGRGSAEEMRPDPTMTTLLESQGAQAPLWINTAWLAVAHVDETVSFVESDGSHGWSMLYNDPVEARALLESVRDDYHGGDAVLFEGKSYPRTGASAERTVEDVLDDPDIMAASARAAVEVDDQVQTISNDVGLGEDDLIAIPFLHEEQGSGHVAYQPGIVNGISLTPDTFGAPDPHGPEIEGQDIFQSAVEEQLEPRGIQTHWIETWDVYHVGLGQVHCGSNTVRQLPATPWWHSEVQP